MQGGVDAGAYGLDDIDADRIATLVEYFADDADSLVVALLPEDAGAFPDRVIRSG